MIFLFLYFLVYGNGKVYFYLCGMILYYFGMRLYMALICGEKVYYSRIWGAYCVRKWKYKDQSCGWFARLVSDRITFTYFCGEGAGIISFYFAILRFVWRSSLCYV